MKPFFVSSSRNRVSANVETGRMVAIVSASEIGSSWCMSTPREVRELSGTWQEIGTGWRRSKDQGGSREIGEIRRLSREMGEIRRISSSQARRRQR